MVKNISEQRKAIIEAKGKMFAAKGLLLADLPPLRGKILQLRKDDQGKVIVRPRYRSCPLHGIVSIETDWKPPAGMEQSLVEFHCPQGHGFCLALPLKESKRRCRSGVAPMSDLPHAQGKEKEKESLPRHRRCPWHGDQGVETDWLPGTGMLQDLVEFLCPKGHGFFCRV